MKTLENFDKDVPEHDIFIERMKIAHPDTDEVHIELFAKDTLNYAESVFDFCNIVGLPHKLVIEKVFDQLNDLIRPQAPDSFEEPEDIPDNERCPVCGQPDNCGDCNHTPVES